MDQSINQQIEELKKLMIKDQTEINKITASIKRQQDKRRNLDSRLKENQHLLEELENKKIALTIEERFGKMDDKKLIMLTRFLEEHSLAITEMTKGEGS